MWTKEMQNILGTLSLPGVETSDLLFYLTVYMYFSI